MAMEPENDPMEEMILFAVLSRLIEVNPDLTEAEITAEGERILAEMREDRPQ